MAGAVVDRDLAVSDVVAADEGCAVLSYVVGACGYEGDVGSGDPSGVVGGAVRSLVDPIACDGGAVAEGVAFGGVVAVPVAFVSWF